jgi:hypothetical protein
LAYPEHEQGHIAWIVGDAFPQPEHADAIWAWARKHTQPADGWLWAQALPGAAQSAHAAEIESRILDPKEEAFVRAGALEALGKGAGPRALVVLPRLLQGPKPRRTHDRSLILESAAAVLLANKQLVKDPAFATACEQVIAALEDRSVADRTKLVIARYLMRVFDAPAPTLEAKTWRRYLAFKHEGGDEGPTVARPTFAGIEAAGVRIVYVLDLSDSMLAPLSKEERRAVVTPPAGEKKDAGPDLSAARTRFDLARAFLELSLSQLPRAASFAVVIFGDEATTLEATPKLVRVGKRSVRAALRELAAIEIGPARGRDRPHGTLRGKTNLHSAIRLAFQLTKGKALPGNPAVGTNAFESGADTLFLLTDGAPTHDAYSDKGHYAGGKTSKDAEAGTTRNREAGPVTYRGPYRLTKNLAKDVARMNFFRKAEIHAIAMAGADEKLMRQLVEVGLGKYRIIGAP